jgi:ribosomal protein S18 acetylase RimI-like enzyme
MQIDIRAMQLEDYENVLALWQGMPGIGLSSADSKAALAQFLSRNPGLSLVALDDGQVVGTILAGNDGRRGYLYHMAVAPAYRRRGVGKTLLQRCLAALEAEGIEKSHLFVYQENEEAKRFWEKCGWVQRHELVIFSKDLK